MVMQDTGIMNEINKRQECTTGLAAGEDINTEGLHIELEHTAYSEEN